jgi:hypothetical protein
MPVSLSRWIGLPSSTGHAVAQGGTRQCLQIIGASRPFLFFWIQTLALTGLNIPLFSREQAISHVLQFTHNAGLESSFLLIFLMTFLSQPLRKRMKNPLLQRPLRYAFTMASAAMRAHRPFADMLMPLASCTVFETTNRFLYPGTFMEGRLLLTRPGDCAIP